MSGLLLDTHVVLWWLDGVELSEEVRARIAEPATRACVSAASHWEIAIKVGLGKLEVVDHYAEQLAVDDIGDLDVRREHAQAVRDLPAHHQDPFDRMLVAQAQVERLTLVSRDRRFRDYDVDLLEA